MITVTCSSETSIDFQRTTWRNITEGSTLTLQRLRNNNLKTLNKTTVLVSTKKSVVALMKGILLCKHSRSKVTVGAKVTKNEFVVAAFMRKEFNIGIH
jgi:hypothetical protein